MQHRTYRYTIQYLGPKGERGREFCTVTVHGNGDRTIRALCEMDDSEVLRDVTGTVDRSFRPLDFFVRLSVKDAFFGSSWFRFTGNRAECEGFTVNEGRIRQAMELDQPPHSFVTHPVACDVWHFAGIDRSVGERIQERTGFSCSPLPNGASGPLLHVTNHRFRYLGRETVDAPAGRFETEHVQFVKADGSVGLDAWCTVNDRVLVKMYFPILDSHYNLMKLTGTKG
jgi:hypothetical protein